MLKIGISSCKLECILGGAEWLALHPPASLAQLGGSSLAIGYPKVARWRLRRTARSHRSLARVPSLGRSASARSLSLARSYKKLKAINPIKLKYICKLTIIYTNYNCKILKFNTKYDISPI